MKVESPRPSRCGPAGLPRQGCRGKEADFWTMRKIEAQHLPEADEAFIKSLGIADGSIDGLRADVARTSSAK